MRIAPAREERKTHAVNRLTHAIPCVTHEDLMVCLGCGGPVINRLYTTGPWRGGWVHTESGAPCPLSGAVLDLLSRHDVPHLCPLCGDLNLEVDCARRDQHDCDPHQACMDREQALADRSAEVE